MVNEICTISIGKNSLDDNYTFYQDGSIERLYDVDYYRSQNNRSYLTAKDISTSSKEKLITNCPEEYTERISAILYT